LDCEVQLAFTQLEIDCIGEQNWGLDSFFRVSHTAADDERVAATAAVDAGPQRFAPTGHLSPEGQVMFSGCLHKAVLAVSSGEQQE
jgi:hypothetical protein